MIVNGDLADTWLDLPQAEDDLPTTEQDHNAQQLQGTDLENREEGMTLGTMVKLGVFHTCKLSRRQGFGIPLEESNVATYRAPRPVDRAVRASYHQHILRIRIEVSQWWAG
jgi:hypothetical protein